jgi:PAS domain
MKHPSNRELYDYWNERRGSRLAPERADIEPSAIRQVLGDTFVLETDAMGHYPFRLAGTRLCALFGRELKSESFVKLWERSGQTAMRELLAVVMEEKTGVVASVTGSLARRQGGRPAQARHAPPHRRGGRSDAGPASCRRSRPAPGWPGGVPGWPERLRTLTHRNGG